VRSRPPSVQPAARPDPPGPSAVRSLAVVVTVAGAPCPEGPAGSGVNGLTPGPLRLLGRLSPAGQGPAEGDTRRPLPPFEERADSVDS
jgi:hypothetical protein